MNRKSKISATAPVYAEAGFLQVRLARSADEIKQAQKLRYQIFYREMQAKPNLVQKLAKRDFDKHDTVCDHLLVIDTSHPQKKWVVGTYRLLTQKTAEENSGFYSANEYCLNGLIQYVRQNTGGKQLLELGRSCVDEKYRSSSTISLLWQGITAYMRDQNVAYMIGCASFVGVDPARHAEALSYLYYYHSIPPKMDVAVHGDKGAAMNMMPKANIDIKRAKRAIPPLIKGYLRLGAKIGRGAYVDSQFGTIDVFILVDVKAISKRYSKHYNVDVDTAGDQGSVK